MNWRYSLVLLPWCIHAASPDFEKDVAPILEARCLSCHDESSAKGEVRLDTREQLLTSIRLGQPDDRELIVQISGPQPEMPKKAEPLKPQEVEILRQWIASGASWPEQRVLKDNPPRDLKWWSLKPISKRDAKNSSTNPVDDFINAKLAEKGLKPVGEADSITLIRRLTYDLTGLPPTPDEVEAFAESDSAKAYSATVERLLASPAFGEKWAQHWLDLARYGETHGYDKDKPRPNAWPYRDFVIRSFNEDKSYPQFVQEQIAGDALYPRAYALKCGNKGWIN